jgi:hypothetical protein
VGEWTGHLGFASDLIVATQPSLIVELGTHWGEAYFTFCQTVEEHGLSCLCYAVDHWLGDEHAGRYGEEVFEDVSSYNERYYRQFSYLLRTTFNDAVSQFGDDSIDLLHIDGLHTYEVVCHDFRTWLPKVRRGGIVLLHDICPRHQDFGVWRLWDEIKAEFPSIFEFHHSWGLGVVRKEGAATNSLLTERLFSSVRPVQEEIRRHYVVYASHLEHLLGRPPESAPASNLPTSPEIKVQVFPFGPTGYSEETSLIRETTAGVWNTLTFELPAGNGRGPLRVDPGHQPCLVEVGDILIRSHPSEELSWSDYASSGARSFVAAGSAAAIAGGNGSLIASSGDDPQLIVTLPDLQGSLELTISLRVSLASNPLPDIVANELGRATAELARVRTERETIADQLDRTTAEINCMTGERDTFANQRDTLADQLGRTTAELSDTNARLTASRAELNGTRAELNATRAERDTLADQRDTLASQVDRRTTELGHAKTELSQLTAAKDEAQHALDSTRELLLIAEGQLRSMHESLSWKVTEPVRRLMTALRSGPRKTR